MVISICDSWYRPLFSNLDHIILYLLGVGTMNNLFCQFIVIEKYYLSVLATFNVIIILQCIYNYIIKCNFFFTKFDLTYHIPK